VTYSLLLEGISTIYESFDCFYLLWDTAFCRTLQLIKLTAQFNICPRSTKFSNTWEYCDIYNQSKVVIIFKPGINMYMYHEYRHQLINVRRFGYPFPAIWCHAPKEVLMPFQSFNYECTGDGEYLRNASSAPNSISTFILEKTEGVFTNGQSTDTGNI